MGSYWLLVVAVVWLAPIAAGSYLAPRRGRSRMIGFASGLLLGWIGVVLFGLISGTPRSTDDAIPEPTTRNECQQVQSCALVVPEASAMRRIQLTVVILLLAILSASLLSSCFSTPPCSPASRTASLSSCHLPALPA